MAFEVIAVRSFIGGAPNPNLPRETMRLSFLVVLLALLAIGGAAADQPKLQNALSELRQTLVNLHSAASGSPEVDQFLQRGLEISGDLQKPAAAGAAGGAAYFRQAGTPN